MSLLNQAGQVILQTEFSIQVTSFFVKTVDTLVVRHIMYGPLMRKPISVDQYAYQGGQSTETALGIVVSLLEEIINGGVASGLHKRCFQPSIQV